MVDVIGPAFHGSVRQLDKDYLNVVSWSTKTPAMELPLQSIYSPVWYWLLLPMEARVSLIVHRRVVQPGATRHPPNLSLYEVSKLFLFLLDDIITSIF